MKPWCLIAEQATKFKQLLKKGEIDPAKLDKISSEERRAFFTSHFGAENASQINKNFEQKLLLKNRDLAVTNWVKDITGLNAEQKAELSKMAKERFLAKKEMIFDPKSDREMLTELAKEAFDKKFKLELSYSQVESLTKLSQSANNFLKNSFDFEKNVWKDKKAGMKYGALRQMYEKYSEDLLKDKRGILQVLKDRGYEAKSSISEGKTGTEKIVKTVSETGKLVFAALKEISNNAVSIIASEDLSYTLTQGGTSLLTHPFKVWLPGTGQQIKSALTTIFKKGGKEKAEDALMAQIYSRPNFITGEYKMAGLLDVSAEQFPGDKLIERIPIVGRTLAASEISFKSGRMIMQANAYDLLKANAIESGVKWEESQVKAFGEVINSASGRGKIKGGLSQVILWAPRMVKGAFDTLTANSFKYATGKITYAAWKESVVNLAKIVGIPATSLFVLHGLGNQVEFDPRSSKVGMMKIGENWYSFPGTGYLAGYIAFLGQFATNEVKNSDTGEITKGETGFGMKDRYDKLITFFTNKANPVLRPAIDIMKGETFDGTRVDPFNDFGGFSKIEAMQLIPISFQQYLKYGGKNAAEQLAATAYEFFGGKTSTPYSKTRALEDVTTSKYQDLSSQDTVVITRLREQIGDAKFKQADKDYKAEVAKLVSKLKQDPYYQELSEEEKKLELLHAIDVAKENILYDYGYEKPRAKQPRNYLIR